MPLPTLEMVRARLSAETAQRISAAYASNEDSKNHVRSSRDAIARRTQRSGLNAQDRVELVPAQMRGG